MKTCLRCNGNIADDDYCTCTHCHKNICPGCARNENYVCPECGGDISYLS